MLKKLSSMLVALSLTTFNFSTLHVRSAQAIPPPPSEYNFASEGLIPEGIDFDKACRCFIVSSVGTGKVGQVSLNNTYKLLADDPDMINSIGVYVDAPRNRLLVAISDSGRGPRSTAKTKRKIAKLGIFDLKSGQKKQIIDLGFLRKEGPHFANDIAVDKAGNIYVTDSMAGLIYKVDKWGKPSVFSQHSFLKIPAGQHGPNGIVYHPNEYLLIANSMTGEIIKISTKNPNRVSKVQLKVKLPPKPDGLEWMPDGKLAVVINKTAKVYVLSTEDDWLNAKVEAIASVKNKMPTTGVSLGSYFYVIHSGFNLKQIQKKYTIEQALFEKQK